MAIFCCFCLSKLCQWIFRHVALVQHTQVEAAQLRQRSWTWVTSQSLDTGGNVLCLDIWSDGQQAGPYMHSIHFSFALGAFIAPVLAIPFLGNDQDEVNKQLNFTNVNTQLNFTNVNKPTKITILYPLMGLSIVACAFCYLIFGFKNFNHTSKMTDQKEKEEETRPRSGTFHKQFLSLF